MTIRVFIPFIAIALGGLVNIAVANEQDNTIFVGAGFSYISNKNLVENTTTRNDLGFPTAEIMVGYQFKPWLGIDIRYGSGLNDKSVDAASGQTADSFEYDIDSYQSVYYRPEITNYEAKLYGLIGYSTVDATITSFNADGDTIANSEFSESGVSYGLGAGWFFNKNVNINIEYRMLLDDDDNEFRIITLGFDYRFHL